MVYGLSKSTLVAAVLQRIGASVVLAVAVSGCDTSPQMSDHTAFVRMHMLTVTFCERLTSPECQPMPPWRLIFAYKSDCTIAKMHITSSYERSPNFDVIEEPTCVPVAHRVPIYGSLTEAEAGFDAPEFRYDIEAPDIGSNQALIAGGRFAADVMEILRERGVEFTHADWTEGEMVLLTFDDVDDQEVLHQVIHLVSRRHAIQVAD